MSYPQLHAIIHYGAETFYAIDEGELEQHLIRLKRQGKTSDEVHVFARRNTLIFDSSRDDWHER